MANSRNFVMDETLIVHSQPQRARRRSVPPPWQPHSSSNAAFNRYALFAGGRETLMEENLIYVMDETLIVHSLPQRARHPYVPPPYAPPPYVPQPRQRLTSVHLPRQQARQPYVPPPGQQARQHYVPPPGQQARQHYVPPPRQQARQPYVPPPRQRQPHPSSNAIFNRYGGEIPPRQRRHARNHSNRRPRTIVFDDVPFFTPHATHLHPFLNSLFNRYGYEIPPRLNPHTHINQNWHPMIAVYDEAHSFISETTHIQDLTFAEDELGRRNCNLPEEHINQFLVGCMSYLKTKEEICVICQDEIQIEEQMASLKCHHIFHETCIKKWLMIKNGCPICRASAISINNE